MLNDQIIADNRALIARNRELECELEQLKAKLGAVPRIADKYHDRASTILESWGDKPMGAPISGASMPSSRWSVR